MLSSFLSIIIATVNAAISRRWIRQHSDVVLKRVCHFILAWFFPFPFTFNN